MDFTVYDDEDTSSADVTGTFKQSIYHLGLGLKYFVIGQASSAFGLYGKFGCGYMVQAYKAEYSSYDKSKFGSQYEDESVSVSDFIFEFGLGMGVNAGPVRIFLSGDLYLPPNEKNGEAYVSSLEGGTSMKLGVRMPVGR